MGSKSKSKKVQKGQQQGQKINQVEVESEYNNKMSSESGVTTPQISDLSDSAFNYDVERNWSVIFTDDNYSTDHDIRSNYSSSSDASVIDGAHSVISETESEAGSSSTALYATTAPSNNRRDTASTLKAVQEETGGDSVTTLKESSIPIDGSFSFPDPIKQDGGSTFNNGQKKNEINNTVDGESPKQGDAMKNGITLQNIIYGLMVLLSLDILVQLLNGSSVLGNIRSSLYNFPEVDESLKTLTIIRHSTKTETHYLPGETITIENTVPYQTVIPRHEYKHDGDKLVENDGRFSSWELVGALFTNFKDDATEASKSLSKKSTNLFKIASKNAFNVVQKAKDIEYSKSAAGLKKKSAELISKTPTWFESFQTSFLNPRDTYHIDDYYYTAVKSLNSGFDSVYGFSRNSFNKLVDSTNHLDYSKLYGTIVSRLETSKEIIGHSSSNTWALVKKGYFNFTKPNGILDNIQGSVSTGLKFIQSGFTNGKGYNIYHRALQNANKSFHFLKSGSLKLWDYFHNDQNLFTTDSFYRASKASKKGFNRLKNSNLLGNHNYKLLSHTKALMDRMKKSNLLSDYRGSISGIKQMFNRLQYRLRNSNQKSRKPLNGKCKDDKDKCWTKEKKSSYSHPWFRNKV